jgi:hypothetical protein
MKVLMQVCFVVYLAVFLQGCSTSETRMIDIQEVVSDFSFIRDGKISRNEVLARLGQPASVYENGRIIIYWVQEDNNGVLQVTTKNSTAVSINNRSYLHDLENGTRGSKSGYYNLVLVFTDNDILEEHSLVFIR